MSNFSSFSENKYIDFLPPDKKNSEEEKFTPEMQERYERYLKEMNLKERRLRGKSVLDIGSESDALLLNMLVGREVTKKEHVAGLDSKRYRISLKGYAKEGSDDERIPEAVARRDYVKAKGERLPFHEEQFDVALARDLLGSDKINSEKLLRETLGVLKEGGQIRAYPIYKMQYQREQGHLARLLKDLQQEGLILKPRWKVKEEIRLPTGEKDYKMLLIITKAGKKEDIQHADVATEKEDDEKENENET